MGYLLLHNFNVSMSANSFTCPIICFSGLSKIQICFLRSKQLHLHLVLSKTESNICCFSVAGRYLTSFVRKEARGREV